MVVVLAHSSGYLSELLSGVYNVGKAPLILQNSGDLVTKLGDRIAS